MICSENIYIIFSLNSHENGTETTLHHPHFRIMADKKWYLQTYFTVKDKHVIIAIRSCTNIKCYLKDKISMELRYVTWWVYNKRKKSLV